MSQSLFPMIQPQVGETSAPELPMLREVKMDFASGRPIFRGGHPVIVEGLQAVTVWAWMALNTPRFRHAIFNRNYGSELESLVGQPYTEALKQAEARRYVTEALTASPYIKGVSNISVSFSDGTLAISCAIETVYGGKELTAHV